MSNFVLARASSLNLGTAALATVLAGGLGAAWLSAGPLTPPTGPVAGTYKTLVEVEPRIAINETNTPGDADSLYRISQPGSYYLTGNIQGVAGKHGIEIGAPNVTIDLNGFDVVGTGPGSLVGVRGGPFGLGGVVKNGSVRGWGNSGIDLQQLDGCRVEGVLVEVNGATGLRTGTGSVILNCVARANTGHGFDSGDRSTIAHCSSGNNATSGFSINEGTTISSCSSSGNFGHGFTATNGATMSHCVATSNTLSGFDALNGCSIASCVATLNKANGIIVNNSSTVLDCSTSSNTLDGIFGLNHCVIRGNTSSSNGLSSGSGAGIHVGGSDNRIEGNTCTLSDRGIDVDLAGNLILRNSCASNTLNWDVAATNHLLVVSASVAPAVVGNSGGTSPAGADPNANITH